MDIVASFLRRAKKRPRVPPKRPDLLAEGRSRLRRRLAQDPDLRAAARRSIVANFGVDAMVRRTEEILSLVVAGRPAQEIARRFG